MDNKKEALSTDLSFKDQKIFARQMEKEVRTSFIDYSMSVITSRALPDARDGMKPGQRRILYAMYEDNLTHDRPFYKSATTVGNVLGRYHPHGDAAVYQTMVRMAQSFSLRYPLIEGHGNFGNIDGDEAAAYRYTEARMSNLASQMMLDIEKNTVDFVPNFDNSRREPTVLPSRFPNLLVNGSMGIAVGMATNIPPHNLREVTAGIIHRIDNPECSLGEIIEFIKGPDFPTRGIIYGSRGIWDAYSTGRGRIMVRARTRIEAENHRIIVTEIPYQVNKSMLVESIANLHKEKRIEGITGLRDESGKDGMRIVIEYRRDANGEVILNQLFKYTQLEDTCAVNAVALVGGEPKVLPLLDILDCYISFQKDVVTRRTQFELDRALREMHIFEGYKIAIDNIEEVIRIIRSSASVAAARENLTAAFGLSDAQTQAIVEMPLGRLAAMERQKIEERLAKLTAQVAELRGILADEGKILDLIKTELSAIAEKFGDDRRTELCEATDEIEIEDLIPKHTCIISMTHGGYIKRCPADTYSAQRRGGRGVVGMTTKEEDFVETVLAAHSHDYLMLFTNKGRVHTLKAYRIPEAARTAKGTYISNLLELGEGEKITTVITMKKFVADEYLLMVTRRGVVKRTSCEEFEYQRRGGKIAISLDEGDELLFVRLTKGEDDVILATKSGQAVRFTEDNIRVMGRGARGVRGIRLADDDEVVGAVAGNAEENAKLLTITERGFGKRSDFEEFRSMKNRGGSGVACHKISEKTGALVSIVAVCEDDDIMLMTGDGTMIRMAVAEIPTYSRTAGGVIVMRLSEGDSVCGFAKIVSEEKAEAAAAEAEAEEGEEVEAVAEASEPEVTEEAEETEA